MSAIVAALGPVFALIVLGYVLKRLGIPGRRFGKPFGGERFWPLAENLTYYLLLPSLLFLSLARADLAAVAYGPIAVSLAGATLSIAGLVLALRPWLKLSGPSFGSVFQGAIRPNTYVGVAPVFALWGEDGLAILAIAIVSVIPLVNLLSVVVVARSTTGPDSAPLRLFALARLIVTNPLIVACVLGMLVSLSHVALPSVIQTVLQWLGTAAMPMGLLTVGAALDLAATRSAVPIIVLTGALKLALFPVVVALMGVPLGLAGDALSVALLYGGLPISASAYVLARLLGGDARLMAGAITATTLAAFVTLPILITISH